MDDLKLKHIAQHHAALSGKRYTQVYNFEPHKWVIDAMREAVEEALADAEAAWEEA